MTMPDVAPEHLPLATRRVIFVDDEPAILEAIKDRLRHMRGLWEMEFYTSAEDALPALQSATEDGSPGAVLVSDWMMPGLNGIGLCERFGRRDCDGGEQGKPRCYVILLTGQHGTENAVEALSAGADDFLTKPVSSRELVARIGVGLRLCSLEHRLRCANAHLSELASTDELTGLANRRRGEELLSAELSRCARGTQHLGVAMIDIDHFKNVNDTYGHPVGDMVLAEVSRRLESSVRDYDALVRWGGEEFLLVCPGGHEDAMLQIGERLRRAIYTHPVQVDGECSISVTVSVGIVCSAPRVSTDFGRLISAADGALYRAKRAGRNRVKRAALGGRQSGMGTTCADAVTNR